MIDYEGSNVWAIIKWGQTKMTAACIIRRWLYSGLSHWGVGQIGAKVSKECIASIFSVKE